VALPLEISPAEVQKRIDAGEKLFLIDVREPHEFAIAKIEGSVLIPMRQVPGELQELEASGDEGTLMVFCHHGMRSLNVVNWLRNQGVEGCQSISGGIDLWSATVDPSIPRY
jgi:rhodanese-related sulfurtransferase